MMGDDGYLTDDVAVLDAWGIMVHGHTFTLLSITDPM